MVAPVVKNRTSCIMHLYFPVLSINIPTRIAPIIPEARIYRATSESSDGVKPNGSKRFEIRAPSERNAPNGSANAIANKRKLQF